MISLILHDLIDLAVQLSCINSPVDSMDFMVLSVDLTFSSGSGNGTEQCVNSTITDDMYSEILDGGRGESFAVILTSSDPDVMVKNNQTLVSILDNDGKLQLYTYHSPPTPQLGKKSVTFMHKILSSKLNIIFTGTYMICIFLSHPCRELFNNRYLSSISISSRG